MTYLEVLQEILDRIELLNDMLTAEKFNLVREAIEAELLEYQ